MRARSRCLMACPARVAWSCVPASPPRMLPRHGSGGIPMTRSPGPAAAPPTGHHGAPAAGPPRPARPTAAEDATVPAQDRGRGDDQPHPGEAVDGQRPGKQSQPRPVRPCQPRRGAGPFAQGDRELMAQHQDLGVLPPLLPARQPEERHGTGYGQEDQLQAHKPKIIARPDEPRPTGPVLDAGGALQSICPGDPGFRHPQAGSAPSSACKPSAGLVACHQHAAKNQATRTRSEP
jgi:hypothetical protein